MSDSWAEGKLRGVDLAADALQEVARTLERSTGTREASEALRVTANGLRRLDVSSDNPGFVEHELLIWLRESSKVSSAGLLLLPVPDR